MPSYLYHWTHADNLASIVAGGLDPAFAEGRLPAVWVCDVLRVNWALWHVAGRHGWEPDHMVLIRVRADLVETTRTAQKNVFTVKHVIPPTAFRGVRVNPVGPFVPAGSQVPDTTPTGK